MRGLIMIAIVMIITTACSMFGKSGGDDEMEKLGKDVLKAHEGLKIDFEPQDMPKAK